MNALDPVPTWPDGLREAFDAYEAALMADDIAVLDDLFAPGSDTLRGDAAGRLVGHDAISAFRSGRGGVAPRRIERVEVRVLTSTDVLTVGVSAFVDGGRGLQTQLWRRGDDGAWRIAAAHVTGRAPAFDRTIWRVLGDPLVRGAAGPDLPLAGVRLAVKDLFAVAGHVVGAGNPAWERSAPVSPRHAAAVAALLGAGADAIGIARTDEFAYSMAGTNAHHGTPPNGADPRRIPGGSTSGPTSAVALGTADLALGTDTGGSVRVPASYQGLWGIRTTHGLVSREGLLPLAQTFDTVGWLARSAGLVRTAALASGAPDVAPAIDDLPFAVSDALVDAADPSTAAAFRAWLRDRGIDPVPLVLPDLAELADTLRVIQGAEAWRNDGAWVSAHRSDIGADVLSRLDYAAGVTADQETAARAAMASLRSRIRSALDGVVLLTPTTPGPAPFRADAAQIDAVRQATLRMTGVAGIGGLPQVSAPFLRVDGAPVGVSFVGSPGSDVPLLDLAASLA